MIDFNFKNKSILTRVAESLHSINHLPRWAIFSIDVAIVIFSLLITYFLMNIWGIKDFGSYNTYFTFLALLAIVVFFLFIFKVSSGVVRHSSIRDIAKISVAVFISLIVLLLINYIHFYSVGMHYRPIKKLFYDPPLFFFILFTFLLLSLFRFYVKMAFLMFVKIKDDKIIKEVLVYGTHDDAVAIASVLNETTANGFNVTGFITPSGQKTRNRILGKKICTLQDILSSDFDLDTLDGIIFSDADLRADENQELINQFIQKKIKLYHSPLQAFAESKDVDTEKNIKSLEIEDLLYRDQIQIENHEISKRHLNKNILVTGGAGSIGSEIVRKVAQFKPNLIVVIDQAETPLNDIKLEMEKTFPEIKFVFHLADVSNKYRIEPLFQKYNFSMVYHAAAYKHVPIVEENPAEAIFVNIMGSRILADLSNEYQINRFVMVSTDKAVNPTNVMGASKRVAELYVQSLQDKPGNTTKFITTRFGNVLGSNGSVIPLFRKQIEAGGPVTVTHEEITRYFMTIPEACELVLQAGTMGQGGEIYVFDMGEPVKIYDLAKKMIKLSGFEPHRDIEIKITGLRKGEKLYEELLSDASKTLPTHHEKIMRAKDETVPYAIMQERTRSISKGVLRKTRMELVQMIKEMVPEFKSQNSEYQCLDGNNEKND